VNLGQFNQCSLYKNLILWTVRNEPSTRLVLVYRLLDGVAADTPRRGTRRLYLHQKAWQQIV